MFEQEYIDNGFWSEQGYDVKTLLDSNFTTKQGQQIIDNWKATYSYFKKYLGSIKTVLDIGFGSGGHLIKFEEIGFKVVGIDPNKTACKLVNTKLKNGKCINGFYEKLTIKEKFDLIYTHHVIEHIENPKEFLEKCKTNLNRNGKILIMTPDCDTELKLEDSRNNKYHLQFFTKQNLIKLLTDNGFEVIELISFKHITGLNQQRFFRILKNSGLEKLGRLVSPYYPFQVTSKTDGFEICCLAKYNDKQVSLYE